jgi:hypothetical protein
MHLTDDITGPTGAHKLCWTHTVSFSIIGAAELTEAYS